MKKRSLLCTILESILLYLFVPVTTFASNTSSLGLNAVITSGFKRSLLIYLTGLLIGLFIINLVYKNNKIVNNKSLYATLVSIIFITGLLTRLFISVIFEGHPIDIACFKGWASSAAYSLSKFYTNGGFVDYPPLYIYILFFIEKIRLLLFANDPQWFHTLFIKLPAITADIISAAIIYIYGKRYLSDKKALFISFIYLFNPVTYLDSTLWGQVDSLFVLILVVGIIKLTDKKYTESTIWFALSILFKPQGLIFLPIIFFVIAKEKNLKLLAKCFLTGVITFIIPVLPFSLNQRFDWIIKLYFNTTSSYDYASVNAYNVFSFLGANWKNNKDMFFIFSYGTWGTIFLVFSAIFVSYYILTAKNPAIPAVGSAMIITLIYVLASKMHERYIFPVLMLLLLIYILTNRRELLILYSAFTITSFIGILQVFSLSLSKIYWVPSNDSILKTVSFINIVLMIVTVIFFIKIRILNVEISVGAKQITVGYKHHNKKKRGRKK